MLNTKVLMSGADYFSLESPINPYYITNEVDQTVAHAEHDLIKQHFVSLGIEVVQVPPPVACQDGVYTANWALVRDGKAVLASLPNARKAEEAYAKKVLEDLGIICYTVPEGLRYSGQGDSLPLLTNSGDYLIAGKNYRSDSAAQEFAAKTLGFELVQLETVPQLDDSGHRQLNTASGWPDSFFYDIDLAFSIIRDDLIAYCPDAFTAQSLPKIESLPVEKIEVSLEEATVGFACNLVSNGQTVIMSNQAPELQGNLIARGLNVVTPDITELKKGGGFIRCISLTLG